MSVSLPAAIGGPRGRNAGDEATIEIDLGERQEQVESGHAGSGRSKRTAPVRRGRIGSRRYLRRGAAGRGVIAARTISTVVDYATTGVRGQGNVLFLFYIPETQEFALARGGASADAAGAGRPALLLPLSVRGPGPRDLSRVLMPAYTNVMSVPARSRGSTASSPTHSSSSPGSFMYSWITW